MIPRFVSSNPKAFGAGAGSLVGAGMGAAVGDEKNRGRNALLGAAAGAGIGTGAGALHHVAKKEVARAAAATAQQGVRPPGTALARLGGAPSIEGIAEHAHVRNRAHALLGKHETKAGYKKSFRDLARKYHPDLIGGDTEKFKEIHEAYSSWQSHPDFQKLSGYFGPFFRELLAINAR